MKKLIIIPTYNEKENIRKLIPQIIKLDLGLDILVVDDNSPDGTSATVRQLKSKNQRSKIFILDRKGQMGFGKSCIAGFNWAIKRSYKIIIQMDADFSHNPKYLTKMLGEINNYDLVIGSRYVKNGGIQGWTIDRKILSRVGNLYSKIVLGININDLTGGFNCWKIDLLKKIKINSITSNGYSFLIEIKYRATKAQAKIKEIPIIFVDRKLGKSKMNQKIIIEAIFKIWTLRFIHI